MTKSQVRKLVYNARDCCFGGGIAQYSGSNKTTFLLHHASFADDEGMQHIMYFSVPQLLAFLNYPMAIRRKMKKLKFPNKEVDYAMRRGVIDLLTAIPIKHLKCAFSLCQE
eukprot:CCRYP_019331-RB/>CCRYP_019331-RB protein AED:0.17 eAED:0.17 QI:1780/0.8/1/1/0/0/6/252/110